jgi:ATP-dependent helicase HrpA
MTAMGVARGPKDVENFPFVEPPETRAINDGVTLLRELGALAPATPQNGTGGAKSGGGLTAVGQKLAQLPVDPRLGRMIVEAGKRGCVREVMILAAALTIQDPRERPTDKQQLAAEKHNRFKDENSDFTGFLNLWNYLQEKQQELSSSAFRRLCRAEFINYLRVREWQDLFAQLRQLARPLGISLDNKRHCRSRGQSRRHPHQPALRIAEPHRHPGRAQARVCRAPGARVSRSSRARHCSRSHPRSSWPRNWWKPAGCGPGWPLSSTRSGRAGGSGPRQAQLQRTALVHPPDGRRDGVREGHPVRRSHHRPAQDQLRQGGSRRRRELFIRHALVEGDWKTHHKFFHRNRALLQEVEELEARMRRRDLLVDDETLFEFYDARIGKDVVSERHFDKWWKDARQQDPDLLDYDKALLLSDDADNLDESAYPKTWLHKGFELPLSYEFHPVAPGSTAQPERRRHGRSARPVPEPAGRRSLPLADSRAACGTGDGADQVPAEADPQELRAGPGCGAAGRGGAGVRFRPGLR